MVDRKPKGTDGREYLYIDSETRQLRPVGFSDIGEIAQNGGEVFGPDKVTHTRGTAGDEPDPPLVG